MENHLRKTDHIKSIKKASTQKFKKKEKRKCRMKHENALIVVFP